MSGLKKASRTKSLSLSDDFSGFPRPRPKKSLIIQKSEDTLKIIKYIDDNIIGKGVLFLGPFGRRKVVYADYASSGRSLQFLEDYINKEVLPAFGDQLCTSHVTGLQSSLYNNESRDLIKTAVNATEEDDIIFCNNPSERLAHLFTNQNSNTNINNIISDCNITSTSSSSTLNHQTTINSDNEQKFNNNNIILFVSNLEPLGNVKSWIDAGAQIERIAKNREGFLDLVDLEKRLTKYAETNCKLIGLFSGVSRLTGILSDDVATTILLHQYNALSLWDFSSAVSSAPVNLNPPLPGACKDAIFFHSNKMIGGVQAPAVLIIKKSLIESFTSIQQETVDVVNIVRSGLVMQLKDSLGTHIMVRQERICKQMLSHIRTIPEIVLLGPSSTTSKRIPTMCFLVRHPRGAFLHHRFVVAVLNDVFGVQSTSDNLIEISLGIGNQLLVEYEKLLNDDSIDNESIRPGFVRITFPFFMSEAEVNYILEALKMVATEAWKLLPQYEVDEKTGEWRHHSNSLAKERKWLQSIRYNDGKMLFSDRRISGPGAFPQSYSDCLQTARNLFNRSRKMAQRSSVDENLYLKIAQDSAEKLRWYMLPGEAHELLLGHSQNVKNIVPFDPTKSADPPSFINMLRHNSLSALDVRRYNKSRSLPESPQPTKMSISPPKCGSPLPMKHPLEFSSPPSIVRFSLGGEVTCSTSFSPPPQVTNLIAREGAISRNRCNSWTSAAGPNTLLSPRLLNHVNRFERSCSRSSQTDLNALGRFDSPQPTSIYVSSCSDSDDIQAYVKEITMELATEIKSEIREVISKVEDVLESTDCLDMSTVTLSSLTNITSAEDLKNDNVSAGDIVEFLKEFSKDLTSEVKSEIREASNAVDEFISPDCNHINARKHFPDSTADKKNSSCQKLLMKQRYSDTSHDSHHRAHEPDKMRSESFPRPNHHPDHVILEHIARPYTGAISKLKLIDPKDTCSQDSGINLSFHETDERKKIRNSLERNRSAFTTFEEDEIQLNSTTDSTFEITSHDSNDTNDSSATSSPKILKRQTHLLKRGSSEIDTDDSTTTTTWHNMPKDIWKQAAEAIDEFDMLKDGDKVLVCISGSSSSLCLIHMLRQWSRARGMHIEFGAVTVGDCVGVDPRALMLYLRDLGIEFIFEAMNTSTASSIKAKLSSIARKKGYNVLALGNTLDKLSDDFLTSLLCKGRLYACPPCALNSEGDIKVIRPFIFVRERMLEDFSIQKNLPSRPSKLFTKMPDGIKSILKVQEVINPNVYDSIKKALLPLFTQKPVTLQSNYI